MKNMTLWNLARACMGRFVVPTGKNETIQGRSLGTASCPGQGMELIRAAASREAKGVVTDSRQVKPGYVFVATPGARVDGHRFISEVFEKGAIGVICEKEPDPLPGPCIVVKDSFQALRQAAMFYRKQCLVPIVGITGSVGKTSTKEFVAAVLSQKYRTHKTSGNFNNEVGVPLTLLSMPEDAQAAVVEMGMNHFGEMHRLSEIVRPDICVITNIGRCHLENLGSREGILRAKSEIFDFMNPEGKICLCGDDDKLETIEEVNGIRPLRFGLDSRKNEIYADGIESCGLFGSEATIHVNGESFRARVPLPGAHMVLNALAATAVGVLMGLSLPQIADGIASVRAVGGRSRVVQCASLTLIDDCYNANPDSMKAALDLLGLAKGRKVAVLGDMFELGKEERQLHAQVGKYAAQKGIDCLLCAGGLSQSMYEAAKAAGLQEAYHFAGREELEAHLAEYLKPGDSVLVKASHGMVLEKTVEALEQGRIRIKTY